MNLQKGKLDYEDYFERGKIHFYNEKYREAKLDFSEYIIRMERLRKVSGIKDIISHSKEKAHFLRAISNFYLSDFNDLDGFEYDRNYLLNSQKINCSFYPTFLFVLLMTNPGNKRNYDYFYDSCRYEVSIDMISDCLKFNPKALNDFDSFLNYLPLEFQIIFKMYFY